MSKRSTFQEVLVDNGEVCMKGWRSKGSKHFFSLVCFIAVVPLTPHTVHWWSVGGKTPARQGPRKIEGETVNKKWILKTYLVADLDKWIMWPNKRSVKFIAWFSWKFAKTEVKHKIYHLQHLSPFCNWFTQKSRFIGLFELYLCFLSFICVFELYLCFRTQSMWPRAGLLVC